MSRPFSRPAFILSRANGISTRLAGNTVFASHPAHGSRTVSLFGLKSWPGSNFSRFSIIIHTENPHESRRPPAGGKRSGATVRYRPAVRRRRAAKNPAGRQADRLYQPSGKRCRHRNRRLVGRRKNMVLPSHWAARLHREGYPVVFIDAFAENDELDPFFILAAELALLFEDGQGTGDTIRGEAARLMNAMMPLAGKPAAARAVPPAPPDAPFEATGDDMVNPDREAAQGIAGRKSPFRPIRNHPWPNRLRLRQTRRDRHRRTRPVPSIVTMHSGEDPALLRHAEPDFRVARQPHPAP